MPLYIALFVEDERFEELASLFEPLGYRPVEKRRHHLTLLFVGDPDSIHRHWIIRELESLSVRVPTVLRVIGIEALPKHKRTNIAVTVEPSRELETLRAVLEEKVTKVFKIHDRYGFHPHITIARRPRMIPSSDEEELCIALRKARKLLPRVVLARDMRLVESRKGQVRTLLTITSV